MVLRPEESFLSDLEKGVAYITQDRLEAGTSCLLIQQLGTCLVPSRDTAQDTETVSSK